MERLPCLIKGHRHPLRLHATRTQQGTGAVGHIWECPTGAYRWFSLDGRHPTNLTRMNRPRNGWKD